jgi:DNA-binding transcriptional LysR family regulator
LGQSPYVWIAAPETALPPGPLTAQDLIRHPILTHARGTVPFRQLEDHFRALGPELLGRARLVPGSNISVCLQMALDGLGVACLPRAMVESALTSGALRALNYGWQPDALRFYARHDSTATHVREAARIAQGLFPPEDTKP